MNGEWRAMAENLRGPAQQGRSLRTTCGREVVVGLIALGDSHRPARRVTVNIGECPDCHDGAWAALTAAEARLLAAALLAQADCAEHVAEGPISGS